MLIAVLISRLGLSVVFGVAGVAKLLDRPGTRDAVTNFGAPASWSGSLAWLLPLGEIAIALGLLFSGSTWASALGALLLLGLFIVAIAVNLGRGRAPECHCFGQLYSRPLGWPTLVRNMVFAAAAGMVIWQGQQAIQASTLVFAEKLGGTQYFPLVAFLTIAITVASVIYFQHVRAQAAIVAAQNQPAATPQGLPLGSPAPVFQLPAYRREQTSLAELLEPRKPLLLIFSNPKCGPCSALFSELGEWQRTYPGQVTVAVLTQGTIKDNFVHIARNDLQNILFQTEREVAEAYQANATPTGILVSPDGRIASAPAPGAENIRAVIHSTLEDQGIPFLLNDSRLPAFLPQPSTQNAD